MLADVRERHGMEGLAVDEKAIAGNESGLVHKEPVVRALAHEAVAAGRKYGPTLTDVERPVAWTQADEGQLG